MKKYLLILLVFTSLGGYSQTKIKADVTEIAVNGVKTVTFINPSDIVISDIIETNSTVNAPKLPNGRIEFIISGGTPKTSGYVISLKKDNSTTEIITETNHSITFQSENKYKVTITGLKKGTYNATINDAICTLGKTETFTIDEPQELTVSIAKQTIFACSGGLGSLTATATGGFLVQNEGYKYVWEKFDDDSDKYYPIIPQPNSNIAKDLVEGTYKVIVEDSNELKAEYIETLVDNPKINVTPTVKDVKCYGDNNGEINFAITGGTPYTTGLPYKVTVTDTENPANVKTNLTQLAAGNYYYTVSDEKGCSFSTNPIQITIGQPSSPFAVNPDAIIQPSPLLNNGKIMINVSGGYGNYSYLWKKGSDVFSPADNVSLTGLSDGEYSVTATDSEGCSITKGPFVLKALNVNITVQTPITCKGGETSIVAEASGGKDTIKYQWFELTGDAPNVIENELKDEKNPVLIKKSGTYKVVVTDADKNTASDTEFVPDSTNPIITATISKTDVTCLNASNGTANIKITNAIPSKTYTFKWYNVTDPEAEPVELTENISLIEAESTISGLTEGNYKVIASDSSCSETFNVTIAPGAAIVIDEISGGFKDLRCYDDKNGSIKINVTGGQIPYTYFWEKDGSSITVNNDLSPTSLEAGNYTVKVQDINKCDFVEKTIKINSAEILKFTHATTDVTCKNASNGSIQLNITGGTVTKYEDSKPLYKISCDSPTASIDIPNQKITGLGFGYWNVTVSDDYDCFIATQTIEIKEPPIAFGFGTETITNVTRNGLANGSIKVNNIGGWGNYSYTWYTGEIADVNALIANKNSDLLKDKPAGKYTVVATDKNGVGCTVIPNTYEIKEPEVLTLEVTATNTKCNTGQGSITAIAKGGTEIEQNQSDRIYSYELFFNNVLKEKQNANIANFTGLEIGQYKVIATDSKKNETTAANTNYKNGQLTTTNSVELIQPTPILITEKTVGVKKALRCFGDDDGILSVSVSGGTPFTTGASYKYVWKKYSTEKGIYEPIGINNPTQPNLTYGKYSVEVQDANYEEANPLSCIGILEDLIISQPSELAFTIDPKNITNASCLNGSDGSIKLNTTGGTAPYTIISNGGTVDNINGIVSGLNYGSYTIRINDANNCTSAEQLILIDQPKTTVFIANATNTPATGFGLPTGSIAITADGGTPGYTYLWKNSTGTEIGTNSPTLSNVKAGTYSILITDKNDCDYSESFNIGEPTIPIVTETHLQSKCNGLSGSLTALANGGATFGQNQADRIYTYTLKNKTTTAELTIVGNKANFTNIPDGDYSLTAKDISGIESNTIDVQFKQPDPIVVSLASKINVNCFGGTDGAIAVTVSGGTPSMVGGNPEYKYQWKKKYLETDPYENFTPTSLNTLSKGFYTVEVRDSNYNTSDTGHCIGILENIEIKEPDDFGFDIDKITYKNPLAVNANDGALHFEITGGKSNYEYKFYKKNANGDEIIINTIIDSPLKTADFNGLTKDHYYISAKDNTGCTKYADFDFRDNPLTISISQTQQISCFDDNNGILSIDTDGGFGTKTISWYKNNVLLNNEKTVTLINVKPGNYYVIIKDLKKVEVTSNTITITQPEAILFSMTQEPVKCIDASNGKILITASGGNGNFIYRYFYKGSLIKDWQNFANGIHTTISDLATGDYTIEVKDTQQCESKNATIEVTSPTAITISNSVIVPATGKALSNGSVTITAQGGNGTYTYQWFKSDNTNINQSTTTAGNLSAGKYYVRITGSNSCSLTSSLLEVTDPPLLETSIAVHNFILCNGDKKGSLKATVIGGFLKTGANYTYKWFEDGNATVLSTSSILNNIGKGSYYVVATDSNGNESKSNTLMVTEPVILNTALTSEYTLCGDGNDWTIIATASGGTSPYNYIWNTGAKTANIDNAAPAKYESIVTDKNGCTSTNSITIIAPTHLSASSKLKNPTCYGGSDAGIDVTSISGIAPYRYLWNTGEKSNVLSNAKADSYSVTITDAKGCIINENYTLENPPQDVIALGEDVTLCLEQSVTINAAIDDDKATYLWKSDKGYTSDKPMITISDPANYTLTVTNKLGCLASDMITIASQNTAINAEFALSSQVFVNETAVIINISDPRPDSIEWILPAEAIIKSKDTEYAEISFAKPGEYEIRMNSTKGDCTAFQTKSILVLDGEYTDPDSTDLQKNFDIKIYPNPSNGIFTVDVTLDKIMPATVKIFSLVNNTIIQSKSENGKQTYLFDFALNNLTSGVYFVLLESQQGSKLRKIIIN